jgi:hypothetical protein
MIVAPLRSSFVVSLHDLGGLGLMFFLTGACVALPPTIKTGRFRAQDVSLRMLYVFLAEIDFYVVL